MLFTAPVALQTYAEVFDADFAEILASQKAFRENYAQWKSRAYLPRDF